MFTHEITAADCTWPEINFEDPQQALDFAAKLEQLANNPNLSDADKQKIEDALDDLFSTLFSI